MKIIGYIDSHGDVWVETDEPTWFGPGFMPLQEAPAEIYEAARAAMMRGEMKRNEEWELPTVEVEVEL